MDKYTYNEEESASGIHKRKKDYTFEEIKNECILNI